MATSLPIKSRNNPAQRARGNMLLMIALLGGIIIVVVVIGIGVMLVLFSQQKGRQSADELALTLAQVLNRDDRQGQMNNLVERSRELVFSSRKAYDDCVSEEFHNMEPLMRDLLEESRTGAQHVEKTRENLSAVIIADMHNAQKDFNQRLKQAQTFGLGWMKTTAPTVKQLELGSIEKVNSNVMAPPGFAELRKLDEKNGFCDPKSGVYIGNINAKLPGADGDLDFKLSSLAPPVGSTISAARLTDPKVFKQTKVVPLAAEGGGEKDSSQMEEEKRKALKIDQIPSAVKVKLSVAVSAGGANQLQDNLAVTTTATTGGAHPAPDLP